MRRVKVSQFRQYEYSKFDLYTPYSFLYVVSNKVMANTLVESANNK